MKNTFTYCLLILLTTLGCGQSDQQKISKSDYSIYSDYWFDKTIDESGPAVAHVVQRDYDFDVLPPNVSSSHRFKVENRGKNPLKFIVGPKTCKCTELKIIDREIAPGETGEIELHWKTVTLADKFQHSGSVFTNDPENRSLKFTIRGKVGREMATTPKRFDFGRIQPDSTENVSQVLLFSEEYESFEIKDISTTFGENANVEVLPISEQQKSKWKKLKSGKNLRLSLNTPKRPGALSGIVSFKIVGPNQKETEHRIEIGGKVIRRLSLEETETGTLTLDAVVHLGRVNSFVGKSVKFLLTVNDDSKKLDIRKLTANPEYVDVDLQPLNQRVEKHGVYVLKISVPPGVKTANFNREDSFGKLEIEFDHERVAPLELGLDFFVIE